MNKIEDFVLKSLKVLKFVSEIRQIDTHFGCNSLGVVRQLDKNGLINA